jgi:hypothetical protein
MGKPESWKPCAVRTDGFEFRQADLPGEAQYHPEALGKPDQVETRVKGYVMLGGRQARSSDEPLADEGW